MNRMLAMRQQGHPPIKGGKYPHFNPLTRQRIRIMSVCSIETRLTQNKRDLFNVCSPTRACVVGASAPYNHGLPLAGATLPRREREQSQSLCDEYLIP